MTPELSAQRTEPAEAVQVLPGTADTPWPRYLAVARPFLAAAIVVAQWTSLPHLAFALTLAGVYGIYVVVALFRKNAPSGLAAWIGLLADTVFFLSTAPYAADHTLWINSLFCLFLIGWAAASFHPREVLALAAVSVLVLAAERKPQTVALANTMLVAGLLGAAASAVVRRRDDGLAGLKRLTAETRDAEVQARAAERQRIADDFHEGPLQCLISFQMRLVVLKKLLERDPVAGMSELQALQDISIRQLAELRAFVRAMRPPEMDGTGFEVSARQVAEAFQNETGVPVTFVRGDAPIEIRHEMAGEVLQIISEALSNVHRHAHATRVGIAVEKSDTHLDVSIDDNGSGFPFSGSYTLQELELLRAGPLSVKRRAKALGAEVQLQSRPGRGSSLHIRIALPA